MRSKFEDFEYAPREEVWDRLQSDAAAGAPAALQPTFSEYVHTPRVQVWDRIVGTLYPARRRRIIWWAAAASLLLLAVTGLVLRTMSDPVHSPIAKNTQLKPKGANEQVLTDLISRREKTCPTAPAKMQKAGQSQQFASQIPGQSQGTPSPKANSLATKGPNSSPKANSLATKGPNSSPKAN
ncbi:MAG TPA: hypothetical protein ENJ82_01340, partial [Bacteroidetes bacterium]|nr:hypothetical protein [Bacteroidota bacterium]